ncbi:MAG: glucosidase, partial [Phycisphaerae bacterium]|nr:glucosidase [Phycisphaerae bacterium]
WYMHPNGQLPAYEFSFNDVNPPVHAWACWRTYKMTAPRGQRDTMFLERTFQKLLINFTWWVNRKDVQGKNIFGGGFLGLDNIGVFDRSRPLPNGATLEQADGTAWMAFYCGTMLSMALELAQHNPVYEDIASKFFEHFIAIVDAMNSMGGTGLWDDTDGFYYDQLQHDGTNDIMRVRSLVGMIPLIACEVLDQAVIDQLPGFKKRMDWFLKHRADLARHISFMKPCKNQTGRILLAVPSKERLKRVLKYLFDESEFLSQYGVRSVSLFHQNHPFRMRMDGHELSVDYEPAESQSNLFGGNSNWRGPIWFPINFLILEALERYNYFYGSDLMMEVPTGSGKMLNMAEAAREIGVRLTTLFTPDSNGQRPCHGEDRRYADDPNFRDLILFYEHFHGDNGRGLGASHQTGWTALVVRCLESLAARRRNAPPPEAPPASEAELG